MAKVMGLLGTFRETLPFHCTDGETEAQREAAVAAPHMHCCRDRGLLLHLGPWSLLCSAPGVRL